MKYCNPKIQRAEEKNEINKEEHKVNNETQNDKDKDESTKPQKPSVKASLVPEFWIWMKKIQHPIITR